MFFERKKFINKILLGTLVLTCAWGVFLRFYQCTKDNFFLYDEGFYLNYNRNLLEIIEQHFPHTFSGFLQAVSLYFRASLYTGKALWFLLVDSRVFFGGLHQWFFPHIVSAIFGTLTLGVIYLFAKRFFDSRMAGYLSLALLCLLPSHVFYSRLALQEAVCAFFFLSGFYFYLFPKHFGYRTVLSSILFVCAYFSNYRLIVIPLFVLFCELYLALSALQKPDFRKYLWHSVIFIALVIIIGSIDKAQNTTITFAWIFHQESVAKDAFAWVNLFSYPYYIFAFEGWLFGILFFMNIYFLYKKNWKKLFPFAFAFFYMAFFSFTAEKGARYLSVILPFMVMGVSALVVHLFEEKKLSTVRYLVIGIGLILGVNLIIESFAVMKFHSDYESSIAFLKSIDPNPKIASTQKWIQKLYVDNHNITDAPKGFQVLQDLDREGYRYLIVCPQAYISWTDSQERFDLTLRPYLVFMMKNLRPIKTFSHFNHPLLERFVFEHNANLKNSITFLKADKGQLGKLRIYDIRQAVELINRVYHPDPRNRIRLPPTVN